MQIVFWDTRTATARMEPRQAKIPFVPDQTDFVNTWHDWHRGFRRLDLGNGVETFQHLTGQPLNEVLIGHLPVPVDGGSPYHPRAIKWIVVPDIPAGLFPSQQEAVSIPDEDRLFDSDDEESGSDQTMSNQIPTNANSTSEINNQASLATSSDPNNLSLNLSHARNLRNTLQRLNSLSSFISSASVRLRQLLDLPEFLSTEGDDLREIIEELTIMEEETQRLTLHQRILRSLRLNGPRNSSRQSPVTSNQETNPSTSHVTLNQTNTTTGPIRSRQERTVTAAERMATVFGTREEVQQADYESPVALMFNTQHVWRTRIDRLHQEESERHRVMAALQRYIIRRMRLPRPSSQRIPITTSASSPFGNLSNGNEVSGYGQPRPFDNTFPQQTNDTDMDTFLDPVQRLVLARLRSNLPFPEWISRLNYDHRLIEVAAEYTQGLAETLSNGYPNPSPLPDEYASDAIQNLIQELLECIYPRQSGESLRTYIARIRLENTPSPRVEQDHQRTQATTIVGGNMNATTQRAREHHDLAQQAAPITSQDMIRSFRPRSHPLEPSRRPLEPPGPPLAPSETMVQLQCIACLEQIANITLVPCGHLLMCRWCSEQHATVRDDQGRLLGTTCPLCRQKIKQRLRIWGLDGDRKEDGGPARKNDMGDGGTGGNVVHAA